MSFNKLIGFPPHAGPSPQLIHRLAHRGIIYLAQTVRVWSYGAPIFKSTIQMDLREPEDDEWEALRDIFRAAGFCWDSGGDLLVWDGPTNDGVPVVKDIYRGLNMESY